MKDRKYKEEWRLETHLDAKTGKPKQVAVYQGKYYGYAPQGPGRREILFRCGLLCAAVWCALLAYFFLNSPSAACMYVLPVAACTLYPAAYWAIGLWGVWRAPEKMNIVQKENGIGRVARSALGAAIIACLALCGDIVFVCLSGNFAREWPAMMMLAAAAAAAIVGFVFARRPYDALMEVSAPKKEKNDDEMVY